MKIEIINTSNLIKVFPETKEFKKLDSYSILKKETFSYQIVLRSDYDVRLSIKLDSLIKKNIVVRKVDYIHAKKIFCNNEDDDYVLFNEDKERDFPDLLSPLNKIINLKKNIYTCLYVTIKNVNKSGLYPINFSFSSKKNVYKSSFLLKIINKEINLDYILPNTIWFHYDAISNYYHLRAFSKKYLMVLDNFLKNQISHGINTIYVPLFTPPLDTKEGLYRTTSQLVDVTLINNKYIFNFDRVFAFMENARKLGYKYFEMSHLFTQWGAKFSPKIMIKINNKLTRLFGWDVPSLSDKYINFITQFLKEFVKELKYRNYRKDEVLFHISDEPNEDSLSRYKQISDIIRPLISPYRIFDALSSFSFYKENLLDEPVVALNNIDEYRKNNIDTYVYFCSIQRLYYIPNRYFNMSLNRLRILGATMYLDNAKGFLQWGYNFYNSQLSIKKINPFECPDADARFPAGDSFVVYPGDNYFPLDSIRNETYFDALQDYVILKMVEQIRGKNYVNKLLNDLGVINYRIYPHDDNICLLIHDRLIKELEEIYGN